jgi:hypothetical protein
MNLEFKDLIQLTAYLVMIVVFAMKLATKDELKDKVKERNEKFDAVFRSLDRHRADCNEVFVRKDMCGSWHQQTKDEIDKLDQDYKDFRHEIRNNFQKLLDLNDATNERINELKELVIKMQK